MSEFGEIEDTVYSITIDGRAVTKNFDPVLIDLSINLTDGGKSDSLDITLDDAQGQIALPREGATIVATIARKDGRGGAVQFEGKTDEPESTGSRGGGMLLSITAHAADLKGKPKEKKQRVKDDAEFGDVAKEWGKEADLDVYVDDSLASIKRDHWHMPNMSFMAWGEHVAEEIGATFKIFGDKAAFVPRNSGKSASGKELPRLVARAGEGGNIINWKISPVLNRARYKKSKVRHYDQKEAKWKVEEVEISDDGARSDLVETGKAANKDKAKDRATSNAEESKRGKGGGSVTIDGDPAAQPQAPCTVENIRDGIDGEYRVTSAKHRLARGSGWTTECELEQPDGKAGKDGRKKSGK